MLIRRNLLLTYCFPPFPGPESYLAAKLFSNMPDSDFDVVTIKPIKDWMLDEHQLLEYISSKIKLINQIPFPRYYKYFPTTKRDLLGSNLGTSQSSASKFIGLLMRMLSILFRLPDPFRIYNRFLYRRIATSIDGYGTMVTWSQYNSISLVGLKLKKKKGKQIKWAAYFGDPWHLNPYVPLRGASKFLNFRMQTRVFKAADLLLFPTEEMANFMLTGYSQEVSAKSRILRHSFDSKLYPKFDEPLKTSDVIIFKYIGQFYGLRNPDIIFKGLMELIDTRPELSQILRVEFIGKSNNSIQGLEKEFQKLIEIIKFKPQVSYIDSLGEMLKADCLVSLDAPAEKNIFLSAKISDYIGAKKPILAITNDGPTSNLIKNYGGWIADPNSPSNIAKGFDEAINYILQNKKIEFGKVEIRSQHNAQKVAKNLLKMLDNL